MVKELRIQHVNHLLKRCDAQIHVLLPALVTAAQSSSANASQKSSVSGLPKETELRFWEWRQRLLAKMKACFELARAPDPPTKIEISVTSSTSVRVSFTAPKTTNGSLVTRYKSKLEKDQFIIIIFVQIFHPKVVLVIPLKEQVTSRSFFLTEDLSLKETK